MTNCPPRLRGDLSKWLYEINTGVYVGNVSGRVREAIWDRVCQNIKNGQATMVFSAAGEQKMDFRTHNTTWETVDFDGIKLMKRPLPGAEMKEDSLKPGFSNAAKHMYAQRNSGQKRWGEKAEEKLSEGDEKSGEAEVSMKELDYTVIDLETTGLNALENEIIEYGALRVRRGNVEESFSVLVDARQEIPDSVMQLTGITNENLRSGRDPEKALRDFLEFIGDDVLVGHTISFDMDFLREACKRMGMQIPANVCKDVAKIARRKLLRMRSYKLVSLAQYFNIADVIEHRALADCKIIQQVYCKLNEKRVE